MKKKFQKGNYLNLSYRRESRRCIAPDCCRTLCMPQLDAVVFPTISNQNLFIILLRLDVGSKAVKNKSLPHRDHQRLT